MQGYKWHSLPVRVKWYAYEGREVMGQTDNYTVDLYRGKGFVLDANFLDPDKWQYLEYVIDEVKTAELPDIARLIVALLHGKNSWKGTASELLRDLRFGEFKPNGYPRMLSVALSNPVIVDALKSKGISIERKRTTSSRTILLSNNSNITSNK